jgi:Zn-dependent peptidase ImmA (M78 family)
MGLTHSPIVKMARRVIKKHSLEVPFDLDNLVGKYAEIVYKIIPIDGVDGICLNLKTAGKTPKVIVNANSPQTRQKFTLAHELGHIIIPWHYGTIIDEIEENIEPYDSRYWEQESQANKFASELLMPFDWIFSLYKQNPDPEYLLYRICEDCGVSERAAEIRLENAIAEIEYLLLPTDLILRLYNDFNDLAQTQKELVAITKLSPKRVAEFMIRDLPGKVTYCIERNNKVIGSGGSRTSHPFYQYEGSDFVNSPYKYFQSYTASRIAGINTHWWVLDLEFNFPDDDRSWREILDKIVGDISPAQGAIKFKATVNGKMSGAHGSWKQKNQGLGIDKLVEDTIYRFNNPDFDDLLKHPDFLIFVKKRCEAFFYK